MILAPRMIQSMEILQLPIMALQERIEQELEENIVLELKELSNDEASAEGDSEVAAAAEEKDDATNPEKELVIEDAGDNELDFDRLEALSRDWDSFNDEHRPSRGGLDEEGDRKHDAMQNMPSRPQSLQDYLNNQLAFLDASSERLRLVRFLITHIDKNGWLTVSLEEIMRGYDQPVTMVELEEALKTIQKLDPPGIGARNLSECLLLQLTPEMPHLEVLRTLIQNHLDDITHNRLPIIQRKTGFDLDTIQAAKEALKHLNPHPGAQFNVESIPYVVPDIAVSATMRESIV